MEYGLGCVNLGSASSAQSEAEQVRMIHAAIDAGVTVFDTADIYGAGASERLLGRALRDRRDRVTISTKGGYVFRPNSAIERRMRRTVARLGRRTRRAPVADSAGRRSTYSVQDFSPGTLRLRVESSLRRLGVDHIDVYQLHGPPNRIDDLLESLDDLRAGGSIGCFGVGAESVDVAISWSTDPHLEVVQLPFGMLDPEARALLDQASPDGPDIWARGVLGGGVIAAALADPHALAGHPKEGLIRSLSDVAADAGLDLDELAIRWAAAQRGLAVILLGMSSTARLHRNIDILRMPPLDADVVRRVADLTAP